MNAVRSAALLLCAVASLDSHAALLVDTGTPPSGPGGLALYDEQALGASFFVPVSTTITAVEGFMRSTYGGTLAAKLYAGDPGTNALYSNVRDIPITFDPRWEAFSGLVWTVGPGTYTLTFEPISFSGYMPEPAPNDLDAEWNRTFNRGWSKIGGADGLGIRVHVTAVPEPASWLLLVSGLYVLARSRPTARTSA